MCNYKCMISLLFGLSPICLFIAINVDIPQYAYIICIFVFWYHFIIPALAQNRHCNKKVLMRPNNLGKVWMKLEQFGKGKLVIIQVQFWCISTQDITSKRVNYISSFVKSHSFSYPFHRVSHRQLQETHSPRPHARTLLPTLLTRFSSTLPRSLARLIKKMKILFFSFYKPWFRESNRDLLRGTRQPLKVAGGVGG